MHGADIGDDGNVWLGNARQQGDLSEVVHAHFQDRRLVSPVQAQNCHRQAQAVIEILRCLLGAVGGAQHRSDHFLGGGLSHASRDAHHPQAQALPVAPGDVLQRSDRVAYGDRRNVLPDRLAHQHRRRAFIQRVGDESMAVARTGDGDEQLSRSELSAVKIRAAETHFRKGRCDRTAAPPGRLFQRDVSVSHKAEATSSRSSKCVFSLPRI